MELQHWQHCAEGLRGESISHQAMAWRRNSEVTVSKLLTSMENAYEQTKGGDSLAQPCAALLTLGVGRNGIRVAWQEDY